MRRPYVDDKAQARAYLLQELLGAPAGFNFILYRHGPFSFGVRDQLQQMEADRVIRLEEQPYPYGPKIVEGPAADTLRRTAALNASVHSLQPKIAFIAGRLGSSNVSTLERIATALYVTPATASPGCGNSNPTSIRPPHRRPSPASA